MNIILHLSVREGERKGGREERHGGSEEGFSKGTKTRPGERACLEREIEEPCSSTTPTPEGTGIAPPIFQPQKCSPRRACALSRIRGSQWHGSDSLAQSGAEGYVGMSRDHNDRQGYTCPTAPTGEDSPIRRTLFGGPRQGKQLERPQKFQ